MYKKELSAAEIEERFAAIERRKPEVLTPEESAHLKAAEAMDDGTTISLKALLNAE